MGFTSEINDAYSDIKESGTPITLLFPDTSGDYDPEDEEFDGEENAKFQTYGLFLNVKDGAKKQAIKATKIMMIPGKGIPERINAEFKIKVNKTGRIWRIVDDDDSIEVLEPDGEPIFYKVMVVL